MAQGSTLARALMSQSAVVSQSEPVWMSALALMSGPVSMLALTSQLALALVSEPGSMLALTSQLALALVSGPVSPSALTSQLALALTSEPVSMLAQALVMVSVFPLPLRTLSEGTGKRCCRRSSRESPGSGPLCRRFRGAETSCPHRGPRKVRTRRLPGMEP